MFLRLFRNWNRPYGSLLQNGIHRKTQPFHQLPAPSGQQARYWGIAADSFGLFAPLLPLLGPTVFVYAALKIRPPFHPVSFRADLIILYTADCLALDLSGVIIIYFSSSNAFLCLSQCMNTWILVLLTEPRLRRKHASGSTKIVPLFNMHWLKYGRCLIIIFRPTICKEYLTKDWKIRCNMFHLKRQPHSTGEQVRINGHGLLQSLLMVALQKIPSRFFQLATSNNRNMCIRQRFILFSTFAVFHCAGYVKIIESTRQISPTEYFISSASLVAAVVNLSASVISKTLLLREPQTLFPYRTNH